MEALTTAQILDRVGSTKPQLLRWAMEETDLEQGEVELDPADVATARRCQTKTGELPQPLMALIPDDWSLGAVTDWLSDELQPVYTLSRLVALNR